MAEKKLTDVGIRRLQAGAKDRFVSDGLGLMLQVKTNGTKRWVLQYTIGGKRRRAGLGVYPEVSIKAAREQTLKLREQIAQGIDPLAGRVEKVETWGKLAQEWYELKKKGWSEQHKKDVATIIRRHLHERLNNMPVAEITPRMVLEIVKPLIEIHNETGHRVLSVCSQVLRYGVVLGVISSDPCRDLRGAVPARKAKRHLAAITTKEEAGKLIADIRAYQYSPIVRAAMLFSAYTFCRPQEIYRAEWREIELDKKIWRIPAEKMKARREHVVPLSRQAISVLEDMCQWFGGKTGWIFPSMRGQGKHISGVAVLIGLRTLGYDRDTMTAHGFRAMASSLLNEAGYRADVIELQLAHVCHDAVRAAYNRTSYFEERVAMMQAYADLLDSLAAEYEIAR